MKRYIHNTEDIFSMSKLTKEFAASDLVELIGEYIYFSPSNSSHGPRIKFYGGTKYTSKTTNAPTLKFTKSGECKLELEPWMNKKKCPNAYDSKYVDNLIKFVHKYLSILLLVWFDHLDEAVALQYFQGNIPFSRMRNSIDYSVPESITDIDTLHKYCTDNDLYKF